MTIKYLLTTYESYLFTTPPMCRHKTLHMKDKKNLFVNFRHGTLRELSHLRYFQIGIKKFEINQILAPVCFITALQSLTQAPGIGASNGPNHQQIGGFCCNKHRKKR